MEIPKKVIIAGFSGAGKTTLAKRLGNELDLPIVQIDERCFNAKRRLKPIPEVEKIVSDICSGEKWILDGMYQQIAEQFVNKADLLIFIDINFFTNTKNVVVRKIKHVFRPRHKNPGVMKKESTCRT